MIGTSCWFPDFAEDGWQIAYSSDKGEIFDGIRMPEHLFIYEVFAGSAIRVTSGYPVNKYRAWSPGNSKLAFLSDLNGQLRVRIYDLGEGRLFQPFESKDYEFSEVWAQIRWKNEHVLLFAAYS